MTEVSNTQNLNAHYSTSAKVARPERVVVSAPSAIPTNHLFNDSDANKRMETICNDIYVDTKKEKSSEGRNFAKIFGLGTAGIVGVLGICRFFK